MIQKINGKKYNTDSAEFVCHSPKGNLYRKYRSIEHFICNGKEIQPVSWMEARDIVYKHGTRDYYYTYFEPKDSTDRTHIDMQQGTYSKLRILASMHGMSAKEYLDVIVNKEYRNRDRHKAI